MGCVKPFGMLGMPDAGTASKGSGYQPDLHGWPKAGFTSPQEVFFVAESFEQVRALAAELEAMA